MVLQVLLLPGLLELLPQPPYPVMVAGGDLPAATERKTVSEAKVDVKILKKLLAQK